MGATHSLTKTLPKVTAEMALSVLAYPKTTNGSRADRSPCAQAAQLTFLLEDKPILRWTILLNWTVYKWLPIPIKGPSPYSY
jgi:hypothetical protein